MPLDSTNFLTDPHVRSLERTLIVLRTARASISDRERWGQGFNRTGKAKCATEWVSHATNNLRLYDASQPAVKRLHDALPRLWRVEFGYWSAVGIFNDAGHRRHRRMVRLFDDAIASVERDLATAHAHLS